MKKSNTSLMDRPTGGGVGSELDPRIVVRAGQCPTRFGRHFACLCLHERPKLDSRMLRGLQISSLNFIKTLLCQCPHQLFVRKGHSGGTRALNEHASLFERVGVSSFRVSGAFGIAYLCTFLDLAACSCLVFQGVIQRMDMSNVQLFVLAALSCFLRLDLRGLLFWVVDGTSMRKSCLTFGLSGNCSDPCVGRHFVQVEVEELFVLLHLEFLARCRCRCYPLRSSSLQLFGPLLRNRWEVSLQSESWVGHNEALPATVAKCTDPSPGCSRNRTARQVNELPKKKVTT